MTDEVVGYCPLLSETCRKDCSFYGELTDNNGKIIPTCIFLELNHLHNIESLLRELIEKIKEIKK